MARTKAASGFGTVLKRGDGAGPEVFTAIAEVLSIDGPETRLDTDDATHMASDNGFEERIATILRTGGVSIELNFLPDDTGQVNLYADQNAKVLRNFKIDFPVGGGAVAQTCSFAAFVESISPKSPHNAKRTQSVSLAISGKPVFAATV